jgi:phosphoglycolate phosphatase-like HAD superfamily hydrolase
VSGTLPVVVCDLDGTLVDSDDALLEPFLTMGIPRAAIRFGLPVEEECAHHGVSVEDYVERYDTDVVQPFPGVVEVIARVAERARWAVCSNKHQDSGRAELGRLGWEPEVAMFTDAFDGPKRLGPVLDALGVSAQEVVFLGDTGHDRACAAEVGARFALAAWNPRAVAQEGDIVLERPEQLLELLGIA